MRADESFKDLQLGLISDLKRKSLPAIAKAGGLENGQGLHHFISQSPWQAEDFEKRKLKAINYSQFMLLQDRSWRIGYSSNENNPIADFYIPALECAVQFLYSWQGLTILNLNFTLAAGVTGVLTFR